MTGNRFKSPNILVFFSDQQRWDTVGAYGQTLDVTPNLDKMAKEGIQFDYAFTCQPVCGPARACIQTGKYATEVKCHTNNRLLPIDEETIAKILKQNGYEVGYIGKWHLASFGPKHGKDSFRTRAVPPERRGGYDDFWLASDTLEFTSHSYDGYMYDSEGNKRFFPEGRFRADAQTDWVLEYLETRPLDKPFFLFNSYIEPHHQNDHFHYEGPKGSKEKFKDFKVPGDLQGLRGDYNREYPDYLGCINSLDANLGRIRAKLEELDIAENTIIIFTSDHGSHFRTRNFEYKRSCHEGSIRIPLIIYGPGFKGGKKIDKLVSLIDLPPSILCMAGIQPPDYMKGHPIQMIVPDGSREEKPRKQGIRENNPRNWPEEVFLQISESHCGRAIRTKKWKYSVRAPFKVGLSPSSKLYEEDFLYDLENDPHEHKNLVKDPQYKKIREELALVLKRKMLEANEEEPIIIPKSGFWKKVLWKIRFLGKN